MRTGRLPGGRISEPGESRAVPGPPRVPPGRNAARRPLTRRGRTPLRSCDGRLWPAIARLQMLATTAAAPERSSSASSSCVATVDPNSASVAAPRGEARRRSGRSGARSPRSACARQRRPARSPPARAPWPHLSAVSDSTSPPFPDGFERLVVGMGCFWGADWPLLAHLGSRSPIPRCRRALRPR
jgi:hypothetical protein